jgi:hypothetical protein
MKEKTINWAELKEALKKVDNSIVACKCRHEKYLQWKSIIRDDLAGLIFLGQIVDFNNQMKLSMTVYKWKEKQEEPMALGYYPYGGCNVYQCADCNRLFFYYIEMGGIAGELLLRVIREELLIFEAPY